MNPANGITLTPAQVQSLKQKHAQDSNGTGRDSNGKTLQEFIDSAAPELCGDGAVMVQWCGMWLGIETDGYCHS